MTAEPMLKPGAIHKWRYKSRNLFFDLEKIGPGLGLEDVLQPSFWTNPVFFSSNLGTFDIVTLSGFTGTYTVILGPRGDDGFTVNELDDWRRATKQ